MNNIMKKSIQAVISDQISFTQ